MMKNSKYILVALAALGLIACESDDDTTEVPDPVVALSAGSADFSTFVSLGNSLTAGFTDNALFVAGQENSMPNLMATQFAKIGGGAFTQPLMSDNSGILKVAGMQVGGPRLIFNGTAPVPLPGAMGITDVAVNNPAGPFSNLGIPGAKSFHLLAPNYGNIMGLSAVPATANPYFVRMTGTTPSARVIDLALAQSPTFFSLWIGNNDVLAYALDGGDETVDGDAITSEAMFTGAYNGLIGALTSGGAKGIIANIPDVTAIPHFTTVPHNPLDPTNPAFGPQIPTLNATFASLNQAFAFLNMPERSITFSETEASPVVIHDESLPNIAAQLAPVLQGGGLDAATAGLLANQFGQSRQATEDDLLVLPSSSVIATLNQAYFNQLTTAGVSPAQAGQLAINGVTFPLEDKWVLLPSEQEEIAMATTAFNQVISDAATNNDLAFLDTKVLLNQVKATGIPFGSYVLKSDLVSGGAFSLDGVHPTARGYALLATAALAEIDTKYGSTFLASGSTPDPEAFRVFYSPLLQ